MIELKARVVHLADRHKDIPEHGTVQELMTRTGMQFARVLWDGDEYPRAHPIANLVKVALDGSL